MIDIQKCAHPTLVEKYAKKNPQSISRSGFFDHPAMQSLNNCIFVFLGLRTDTLGISGLVI